MESSVDSEIETVPEEVKMKEGDRSKDLNEENDTVARTDMKFRLDDTPPWYLCILLGFQHYLTMIGGCITLPLLLAPALCIQDDRKTQSEIFNSALFVSGMVTILQTTLGTRLPIVQGATFNLLIPIFAMVSVRDSCPDTRQLEANTTSVLSNTSKLLETHDEVWKSRMNEISGSIIVSSLSQVILGLTGTMGFILRFIGPLTVAPILALLGLTLVDFIAELCAPSWWLAFLTVLLIAIFSQYLKKLNVPCVGYSKGKCKINRYPLFEIFPVVLSILVAWVLSAILTATGVFTKDKNSPQYLARADSKIYSLTEADWFRVPYPFQWGWPTVSAAGTLGMFAGVFAGILESLGDYYACARLIGAPVPPVHAINRGIFIEGIGCVLSGIWGTGAGTTSYSENIGVLAVTKVGSRKVIVAGAVFMMILSTFGKFGALFISIPDPIVGGVSLVTFGIIISIGISNLQGIDLQSSRNLFIFGVSVFGGLGFSNWLNSHPGAINTGVDQLDDILAVVFGTSMFFGGLMGFILDNTMPEKDSRRQKLFTSQHEKRRPKCYDLPFGMTYVEKYKWLENVPISPTYQPRSCRRQRKHSLELTEV